MKDKISILEITYSLTLGGTEKTLQLLCEYLDKSKYDVFACGFYSGGLRESYIRKVVKDLLIANGDIEEIKRFVIKNNISIVHWHGLSHGVGSGLPHRIDKKLFKKYKDLLIFFKEHKIKIIESSQFSTHNGDFLEKLVDKRIFVSKTNILKFLWKYPNISYDKYGYIYNPLNCSYLEKFRLSIDQKKELRNKYNLSENDFIIGKIARADIFKWDDTIINIVPLLLEKIPNVRFLIRSIPSCKVKLLKKLGILKHFVLLPETGDEIELTETYQLLDVMLHTSKIGECCSLAFLEGMFFGLPIITSCTDRKKWTVYDRDNSQLEILGDHNKEFVSNDYQYITEKILELKNNTDFYNSVSNNNIKRVYDCFNISVIIKDFEKVFDTKFCGYGIDFNSEMKKYTKNLVYESYKERILSSIVSILEHYFGIINRFLKRKKF